MGIILLLLVILLISVTVSADLGKRNIIKVKVFGIAVYNSEKIGKHDTKKKTEAPKKSQKPKENKIVKFLKREKEDRGFSGALNTVTGFLKTLLSRLIWILKKCKIGYINLKITVASDNAATTALEYGGICTAVYPLLSLITANAKVKEKKTDITADFNKTATEFRLAFNVRLRIIYAFIAALYTYKEIKRIYEREE